MNLASRLTPNLLALLHAVTAHAETHLNGVHGLYIVGGFVRDLLLGKEGIDMDIDLVVEGDAIALVESLVRRFGGENKPFAPFGTATWRYDGALEATLGIAQDNLPTFLDFATTRTESYAHPAALPTVTPIPEPGALIRDLHRRDFTINTMAIRLLPPPFGEFVDLLGGHADLDNGIIRILHDGSFIDDPTRIFRAVRFEQRFDFKIEHHTETLIAPALPLIEALSGERLRHEFDLILAEARPEKVLRRLAALGILAYTPIAFDGWIEGALIRARELYTSPHFAPGNATLATVYWAILGAYVENRHQFVGWLRLEREAKHAIEGLSQVAPALPQLASLPPSRIYAALHGLPEESLIAAAASAPTEIAREAIFRYWREWRHVKPSLTGHDLIAMGLRRGPLIGKLLARLRDAYLDGLISDTAQERAYLEGLLSAESALDEKKKP